MNHSGDQPFSGEIIVTFSRRKLGEPGEPRRGRRCGHVGQVSSYRPRRDSFQWVERSKGDYLSARHLEVRGERGPGVVGYFIPHDCTSIKWSAYVSIKLSFPYPFDSNYIEFYLYLFCGKMSGQMEVDRHHSRSRSRHHHYHHQHRHT